MASRRPARNAAVASALLVVASLAPVACVAIVGDFPLGNVPKDGGGIVPPPPPDAAPFDAAGDGAIEGAFAPTGAVDVLNAGGAGVLSGVYASLVFYAAGARPAWS